MSLRRRRSRPTCSLSSRSGRRCVSDGSSPAIGFRRSAVAAAVAINPNTVLKAYRELEHEGLVEGRPGQGTYVVRSLSAPSPQTLDKLRGSLESWVDRARRAGLEPEHIKAVVDSTIRSLLEVEESA